MTHLQNILALGSVGWPELLVILIIALIIWGKRLPEVAHSIGKSLTAFKKGMNDTTDEIQKKLDQDENKDEAKKQP